MNRYCACGYTLLELLVVIAILGIMGGIAFPSYTSFVEQEKVKSSARQMASSVTLARSAAIKSGIPVVMCASSNGTECSDSWSSGWLLFRDDDRDNELDSDESIVRYIDAASSTATISVAASDGSSADVIRFNYRGSPSPAIDVNVSKGKGDIDLSVNAFGKTRIHEN